MKSHLIELQAKRLKHRCFSVKLTKILKNEVYEQLLVKPVISPGVSFLISYACGWNCTRFLYHNLHFRLPILSSLLILLILLSSEAVVWWCSAKKLFWWILQNFRENSCTGALFLKNLHIYRVYRKIRFWCMFSWEFCKISLNTSFKEPVGRLLQHKYLSSFQEWCHTYFPTEYFLGLIWRLGTRVNSIF